jgi:hypothetical protein
MLRFRHQIMLQNLISRVRNCIGTCGAKEPGRAQMLPWDMPNIWLVTFTTLINDGDRWLWTISQTVTRGGGDNRTLPSKRRSASPVRYKMPPYLTRDSKLRSSSVGSLSVTQTRHSVCVAPRFTTLFFLPPFDCRATHLHPAGQIRPIWLRCFVLYHHNCFACSAMETLQNIFCDGSWAVICYRNTVSRSQQFFSFATNSFLCSQKPVFDICSDPS